MNTPRQLLAKITVPLSIACAFLGYAPLTHATNWLPVSESDSLVASVDTASITTFNGLRNVWVTYDFKVPQIVGTNPPKVYRSSVQLQSINCGDRKETISSAVWYSDQNRRGSVVLQASTPSDRLTWRDIVPGSVLDQISIVGCTFPLAR